ncbi:hypothetical protein WM42_1750 [Corynebacterium simulans]|nr:hypothetical protein WM42_1750 [Corynebacterium simulans]
MHYSGLHTFTPFILPSALGRARRLRKYVLDAIVPARRK